MKPSDDLLPHVFVDDYCKFCGMSIAIQSRPGEPCDARNGPVDADAVAEFMEAEFAEEFASELEKKPAATRPVDRPRVRLSDFTPCLPQILWLGVQTAEGGDDIATGGRCSVQIIGVFATESLAIAACRSPTDCIGPLELNYVAPVDAAPWAGAYYPLAVPPVVIGDLDRIVTVPAGHVTIGDHGEAYWNQVGVTEEEHAIPGACPECGSGPVEGNPGVYVLPRGWPASPLCRTCERRTRQMFYNIGYGMARRREEEVMNAIECGPSHELSPELRINPDDILVETLRVGISADESGKPGLILAGPDDSIDGNQTGDATG